MVYSRILFLLLFVAYSPFTAWGHGEGAGDLSQAVELSQSNPPNNHGNQINPDDLTGNVVISTVYQNQTPNLQIRRAVTSDNIDQILREVRNEELTNFLPNRRVEQSVMNFTGGGGNIPEGQRLGTLGTQRERQNTQGNNLSPRFGNQEQHLNTYESNYAVTLGQDTYENNRIPTGRHHRQGTCENIISSNNNFPQLPRSEQLPAFFMRMETQQSNVCCFHCAIF